MISKSIDVTSDMEEDKSQCANMTTNNDQCADVARGTIKNKPCEAEVVVDRRQDAEMIERDW